MFWIEANDPKLKCVLTWVSDEVLKMGFFQLKKKEYHRYDDNGQLHKQVTVPINEHLWNHSSVHRKRQTLFLNRTRAFLLSTPSNFISRARKCCLWFGLVFWCLKLISKHIHRSHTPFMENSKITKHSRNKNLINLKITNECVIESHDIWFGPTNNSF